MIRKTLITASVLALAAFPAVAMQDHTKPTAKPAEAAMAKAAKTEVKLAVTGLTEENAPRIESALTALKQKLYVCPGCDATKAAAGKCPPCRADLVAQDVPVFEQVAVSDDENQIELELNRATMVRLSQIENTLKSQSVEIDREELPLGPHACLVYQGKTEADAETLEAAFKSAAIADARATFDATKREIHVVIPSGRATYSTIEEVGANAETPIKLTDVIWGNVELPMG